MELYFVIPSFGEMEEIVALLFVQLLFWLWMTLFFISVVELGYDLWLQHYVNVLLHLLLAPLISSILALAKSR